MICLASAAPAAAAKTVDKANLVAAAVEIANSGAAPVLCQAEIAHWFAMDLATIAPGRKAALGLYFDTKTGTWAAINAVGEALPVERAWCGLQGHTYETRWNIDLGRDRPEARQFDCRATGARLDCR